MRISFNDSKLREAMITYVRILQTQTPVDDFEESRNEYMQIIISQILTDPESWDERTSLNGVYISQAFFARISEAAMTSSAINQVYSMLLRFFIEEYINNPSDASPEYQDIRKFSTDNINMFGDKASSQVHYALYEMNTSIFKALLNSEDLSSFKKLGILKENIKNMQAQWDQEIEVKSKRVESIKLEWKNELNEKEERVRQLQEALDKQKNAFNFVGLYDGFDSLGEIKKKQLMWARGFLITLGILLPSILIGESIHFYSSKKEIKSLYDFLSLLPAASLSIVIIYYFRISLTNYNSIRAQIMQIDLRKSLCQFIQSYAEYSEKIKEKNASTLDKFEDVVFSNIMSSEDKIPSTFDGIEQIANLITALKGKSN